MAQSRPSHAGPFDGLRTGPSKQHTVQCSDMSESNSFDSSYEGVPPWDIGRPQPEVVKLAEAGKIVGRVLDVGCGTGENALYLTGLGYEILGVDFAAPAVDKAREKALDRDLRASFEQRDALKLADLDQTFDTAIDSGLFHTFDDDKRPLFVVSLATVVRSGGTCYMICFSERESGTWGPRRVTQAEIRDAFSEGWTVEDIRPATFETNLENTEVKAWLASIRKA